MLLKSSRFKDLTGKIYGERIVTGFSHQDSKSGNYYWKVRCSCGRDGIVSGTRLRLKQSRCSTCAGRDNGRKGMKKLEELNYVSNSN